MESATSEIVTCNKVIREKLLELREQPGWSNNILAKRMGVNSSYVSQYLNPDGCKFPGDMQKFERAATDLLDNEARRRASGVDTAACAATEQGRTALEYIRKTSDIGIILDESGAGKTRAQELYIKDHSTAILYRCYSWQTDRKSAETFMFNIAGQSGYDGRTKRAVHAVDKLRGSERLIIVDDAHFLHFTAMKWWVDFAEATQMPMAFWGTYALLNKVELDPQIFSRIGLKFEITKRDGQNNLVIDRELIKHLIKHLVPGIGGESRDLADLCEQVAREHGHYRSVHKQLKVAVEIKAGNGKLSHVESFRAAHTMLVRNYPLN